MITYKRKIYVYILYMEVYFVKGLWKEYENKVYVADLRHHHYVRTANKARR